MFAELGKKIDRIAAYLRTQQRKANIAAEEAQRLQQRRRSAEQRVSDVKEMLTYFMRCRGLKRLEGELNTIRLQTNSQPALQIDDWELPQEFCLHTGSIPHRLLKEMLEHLPVGLRGEFLQAMINTEPNPRIGSGCAAAGRIGRRSETRTRLSYPDRLVLAPFCLSILDRKEVRCMLRLEINLRVRRSVRAKCLCHPRYNPECEGAGAIRAGCRYCLAIYELYAGKLAVERSLQVLEQHITRCASFNAAAP